MSRKTIPRETEKPKKLTRAQKKEIDAVLRKYKGDGKPRTAQATIPYEAIYPDGVCRIDRRTFSKCIAFEDISYQLAQPETRTAIFEHLCDLYNYVDAFAALPKQEQSILILFCVLELGDGEIGDLMEMSRSAVQRHRAKTLNELRKKLKAHLPEGG